MAETDSVREWEVVDLVAYQEESLEIFRALGDDVFERELASGRRMPWARAAAYALEEKHP